MCKLFSIRVPAQLGYYYDSEFIELLPSKDSLNYIEFKEYQKGDVNKAILKNELDVLYTISDNQIVVKGSTNLNKEWYISPLYTNPKRYGNVIVLPEIILSTSDNEVVRSILNKYKEYIHLESIIRGKKYKLSC